MANVGRGNVVSAMQITKVAFIS
ncbi:hypothetical protein CCACVL1_01981 [Corchorus capsularis]|uniref:Uncharacterized protein n=1 Tax=Corchorus capsularis TaxID=210143 RepID=A0A1R3KE03_COCAP|nr:hypothetical protein CCACVL1_01981 [Corchorus capsularis]